MTHSADRSFPWLTEYHIAHRGLYDPGTPTEENTVAAVAAAVEAGYAVEIDVRTSADDIIVVFHDKELDRLTDGTGPVSKWGFAQLRKLQVGKSGRGVPSLPDILEVVDGRVPIFIELKSPSHKDIQRLCAGVRHCFEGYKGPVAVMSFNPRIAAWFRQYMPNYARGVVLDETALLNLRFRLVFPYWMRKIRPDFLACDVTLLPNDYCAKWRKKGHPLLTWTVNTAKLEDVGRQHADALIFEKPAVVSS